MNHEKFQQNIKWMHVDILLPHWFSILKNKVPKLYIFHHLKLHTNPALEPYFLVELMFCNDKVVWFNIEFIAWATECNSGEQKELTD